MSHDRLFHHHHAAKLDDPARRAWLPPDDVLARLAPAPGMAVADLGAGTGYFAIPLAQAVLPGGSVTAVDLQPEMLDLLRARIGDLPIALVRGEVARTTLPDASQDLVLVANVWHELDDRPAAVREIARITRPGGRIAVLDWRPDADRLLGPPLDHRLPAPEVAAEIAASGSFSSVTAELVGLYSYLVLASKVG